MASLADQYTYSQTTTFQNRVKQAVISAAVAIQNEATSAAFHYHRAKLAQEILMPGGMTNWLVQFAEGVANDATVSGKIATGGASGTDLDTDIASAVSALWTGFAVRV